jgi:hypothetical protein
MNFFDFSIFENFHLRWREKDMDAMVGYSGKFTSVEKQKPHRQHSEEAALGSYSARPYITTTISLVPFFQFLFPT